MYLRPMFRAATAALLAPVVLAAQDTLSRNQDLITQVQRLSVADLGARGSQLNFGDWFARLGGVGPDAITWEVNDCGEGRGGRIAPTCVTARMSRAVDAQIAVDLQVIDLLGRRTRPSVRSAVIQSSDQLYGFSRLDSLQAASQRISGVELPLHQEPRHRLLWEAGPARIFDVVIPPGDTTLYHIHDTAILYVPVSIAPFDYQLLGTGWKGSQPDDADHFRMDRVLADTFYAWRKVIHRVTNTGKVPLRLIAISNAGRGAGPATFDWSLEIPGHLELTSSWYQVTRLELPAGVETEWSRSSRPVVIVQPAAGDARLQREKPDVIEGLGGVGGVQFVPAGQRYRLRNDGETPTTLVVVQVR